MSSGFSVVHSLPVNVDADGATLEIPKDFSLAGGENHIDKNSTFSAHLRGRKLVGKAFDMPPDSEALIVQNEDMDGLEDGSSNIRVACSSIERLIIWNTDAPSDASERIQSALLWSKLNAALCE